MKRFVAALAALLIATPAFASVLVVDWKHVDPGNAMGSSANQGYQTEMIVIGMLDRIKPTGGYRVIDANTTRSLWLQNGYDVIGWDVTAAKGTALTQFDAVIHINWRPGLVGANGAQVDSLTLMKTTCKWPTVPQVLLGVCGYPSGKSVNAAACSTSVSANFTNTTYTLTAGSYLSWNPKGAQAFIQARSQGERCASGASLGPGIWRNLLGYNVSTNFTANTPCTDCFAVTRSAVDSVTAWARLYPIPTANPSTSAATTTAAPLIFASIAPSGSGNFWAPEPLAVALAYADSCAGAGKVWGKKLRAAIMVGGYFQTTDKGFSPVGSGSGVYCSTQCDTINQKATWDSLAALKVKFSVAISTNADSISALGYQARIIKKCPLARLTPEDYMGTALTFTSTGGTYTRNTNNQGRNFGSKMIADIWGTSRTRNVGPATTNCAEGDTCTYCGIVWSFQRCDSISKALGLAGTDHVIWAPSYDWTNKTITRTNATLLDSVLFYAWQAGVRGFVGNPEWLDTSPNIYVAATSNPMGWGYSGKLAVHLTPTNAGVVTGYLPILTSRGPGLRGNDVMTNGALHPSFSEFSSGWLTGQTWYPPQIGGGFGASFDARTYIHDFFLGTDVLMISAGMLGGDHDGVQPPRFGYWFIKSLVGLTGTLNSFDPAGGRYAEIVYPEDLTR